MSLKTLTTWVLNLVLVIGMSSCASKKTEGEADSSAEEMSSDSSSEGPELYADSDSGKAGDLQTVYFAYNSSVLSSTAKESLDNNANYLKNNPSVSVQVEGHCDERGGIQYNLALGERRANAAKNYLVASGVDSSRVTTISYGKERPLEFGHDESAWSKNRRANMVITAK